MKIHVICRRSIDAETRLGLQSGNVSNKMFSKVVMTVRSLLRHQYLKTIIVNVNEVYRRERVKIRQLEPAGKCLKRQHELEIKVDIFSGSESFSFLFNVKLLIYNLQPKRITY